MQTNLPRARCSRWGRPVGWTFAFAVGCATLAGATATQWLLHALGIRIYFSSFLVGVFAAGVVAGGKGAAIVLALAIPLVWWAFMPPHLRVQSSDAGRDRCHENFFAFRPVAALRSRMLARPHLPERSMTAERKPSTAGQPPAIPSGSSPYFLMRRPLSTSTPAFGTRMNM